MSSNNPKAGSEEPSESSTTGHHNSVLLKGMIDSSKPTVKKTATAKPQRTSNESHRESNENKQPAPQDQQAKPLKIDFRIDVATHYSSTQEKEDQKPKSEPIKKPVEQVVSKLISNSNPSGKEGRVYDLNDIGRASQVHAQQVKPKKGTKRKQNKHQQMRGGIAVGGTEGAKAPYLKTDSKQPPTREMALAKVVKKTGTPVKRPAMMSASQLKNSSSITESLGKRNPCPSDSEFIPQYGRPKKAVKTQARKSTITSTRSENSEESSHKVITETTVTQRTTKIVEEVFKVQTITSEIQSKTAVIVDETDEIKQKIDDTKKEISKPKFKPMQAVNQLIELVETKLGSIRNNAQGVYDNLDEVLESTVEINNQAASIFNNEVMKKKKIRAECLAAIRRKLTLMGNKIGVYRKISKTSKRSNRTVREGFKDLVFFGAACTAIFKQATGRNLCLCRLCETLYFKRKVTKSDDPHEDDNENQFYVGDIFKPSSLRRSFIEQETLFMNKYFEFSDLQGTQRKTAYDALLMPMIILPVPKTDSSSKRAFYHSCDDGTGRSSSSDQQGTITLRRVKATGRQGCNPQVQLPGLASKQATATLMTTRAQKKKDRKHSPVDTTSNKLSPQQSLLRPFTKANKSAKTRKPNGTPASLPFFTTQTGMVFDKAQHGLFSKVQLSFKNGNVQKYNFNNIFEIEFIDSPSAN